jgi:rod shape determining protein RodA
MLRDSYHPTENVLGKLLRFHWPLVFLMLALSTAGVFFIQSATHLTDRPELIGAANQQMMWMGIGFVFFLVFSLINYRWLLEQCFWIYAVAIIVLIATLIVAKPIHGAKCWIRIFGVGIQSAELAKFAYICTSAYVIWLFREHIRTLKIFFIVLAVWLPPVLLILKAPDVGSSSVFVPIAFIMLYVAGARKRYLFVPVIAAGLLFLVCFVFVHKMDKDLPFLKKYQNDRIRIFFDPSRDPRGAGWTITQSLIAVGSGGLKGKGYMKGDQNIYGFLPKNIAYNDFIFSVIAEEFGFVGGSMIILGEALLLIFIVTVIAKTTDYLAVLVASGILGMLIGHFFVNIGMTIKVVPITGIPLPFISYGGTFMVVCMACLGIIQSIWIHRDQRDSF